MATFLERLNNGEVIIGDGSYVFTLEKRGYVMAGSWTPEATCEHPDAVKQLGLEYARAGADITQTFSFYATEDQLNVKGCKFSCAEINQAACDIAKSICKSKGTILAGGVTQTSVYEKTGNKADVQNELKRALQALIENDVDLIIVEYIRSVEEMEWAIELALGYGKPVAATMCMGPLGDSRGVPVEECALRMAKAGAHLVGLNCLFDPFIVLEVMKKFKKGLENFEGQKPFLMAQPLGFKTPDAGNYGWIDIPEFPYATEPRQITRWEAARYAREAYDLGVRYIGGCCGFEPYHIRAMAEELSQERGGKLPESSMKSDIDLTLTAQRFPNRANKNYWYNMAPATGRPMSATFSQQPDPQCIIKSVLN